MRRLFYLLKWFWTTIALALALGIGINLLFTPFRVEVSNFLKSYWHELVITWLLLVLLTIWAVLSRQKQRQQTLSVEQEPNALVNRYRKSMIQKVRTIWITGVLERSIFEEILITLDLTEIMGAVERPMDIYIQYYGEDERSISHDTKVVDIYQDSGGLLLILGEPGAGKTTLLLELTRDLLTRAEDDESHPIPVVFPLPTWANLKLPLSEWLVDELVKRYDVSLKLAKFWMDSENIQILPLLDGLDEVAIEQRAACIDAINQFRHAFGFLPLVVCSRTDDYEEIGVRLRLQSAIRIESLSPEQVDKYIERGGNKLAVVQGVLRNDTELLELVNTPLLPSVRPF